MEDEDLDQDGTAAEEVEREEVWFTPDRARFFLVPRGIPLPSGEDTVRGPLPVRVRRVDLEAMSAWEVPREVALAEIDRRVGAVVGDMRGLLGRLVDAGRKATGTGAEGTGVDEIPNLDPRAVVGLSAGEIVADPAGARKVVSGLLDRAADAAEYLGAVTDPGEKEKLKGRLHELEHEVLDTEGAVPRRVKQFEDGLDEVLPKLGAGLDRMLASIKRIATPGGADRRGGRPDPDADE